MDSDVDENCNDLSQISFSDFEPSFVSSTPAKNKTKKPTEARKNVRGSRRALQDQPVQPPSVQPSPSVTFAVPVLLKCPICPKKEYKLKRYYEQHMLSHKVKGMAIGVVFVCLGCPSLCFDAFCCFLFYFIDAWAQIPDVNLLVKNSTTICNKALQSISDVVSFGDMGRKFKELVKKAQDISGSPEWKEFCCSLCENFASSISSKKIMLPSTMWNNIFEEIENVSSSLSIRNNLKQLLFKALSIPEPSVDPRVVDIFICDIVLYTGEQMLSFIKETIIGTRKVNLPVFSFDVEDRQTIHFVGGSVMHNFKKRGRAFSGNKDWQQIVDVIETRVDSATSPDVDPPSDSDKAWTEDQNRGGLIIIGSKCMNMLMGIAAVVCKFIEPNGTLSHEKVLNAVYSSPVPVLWDDMVGCDKMSESLSLRFMNGVVKNFSQKFGSGLMRRKLNEVHEKPYASMNMRHNVAPRSKSK